MAAYEAVGPHQSGFRVQAPLLSSRRSPPLFPCSVWQKTAQRYLCFIVWSVLWSWGTFSTLLSSPWGSKSFSSFSYISSFFSLHAVTSSTPKPKSYLLVLGWTMLGEWILWTIFMDKGQHFWPQKVTYRYLEIWFWARSDKEAEGWVQIYYFSGTQTFY